MACETTKYLTTSGLCVYEGNVSIDGNIYSVSIDTKLCGLVKKGLFLLNINNDDENEEDPTATIYVFISTCFDAMSPLFSTKTNQQVVSSDLISGVTYLISYDSFSGKFFIHN